MTPQDRLKRFIAHKGLTISAFERNCGLGNGFVSKVGDSIRREKLELISNAFPDLNLDWIINEKGDMLTDYVPKTYPTDLSGPKDLGFPVKQPSELLRQVRMFTVTPTATFTEMASCFNDDMSTVGIVPEPGEFLDKSYAVFEIRGNSMEPTVRDHAKILCKEMPESRWHDAEGVVVISYQDKVVLKRIKRNDFYIDSTLLLASDNPEEQYSQEEKVEWSDIHAIFKAKRILSQDIV